VQEALDLRPALPEPEPVAECEPEPVPESEPGGGGGWWGGRGEGAGVSRVHPTRPAKHLRTTGTPLAMQQAKADPGHTRPQPLVLSSLLSQSSGDSGRHSAPGPGTQPQQQQQQLQHQQQQEQRMGQEQGQGQGLPVSLSQSGEPDETACSSGAATPVTTVSWSSSTGGGGHRAGTAHHGLSLGNLERGTGAGTIGTLGSVLGEVGRRGGGEQASGGEGERGKIEGEGEEGGVLAQWLRLRRWRQEWQS